MALLLCDDLLFGSRITGAACALGLSVRTVRTSSDLLARARQASPACVLLDLHNATLEIESVVAQLRTTNRPTIVGFGSHVDAATLQRARAAGCDVAWPRSKFVDELESALPIWLDPKGERPG